MLSSEEPKRKSRRLSGDLPPPLPPPSAAGSRTSLRGLLATDAAKGRAVYGSDASKSWTLDGRMKSSTSTVSSVTLPSPFDVGNKKVHSQNRGGYSSSAALFDTTVDYSSSDDESEDKADMETKLIRYDELKRMFGSFCVCKTCGSPVKLSQETFSLATNLYLTCKPKDKRWAVHNHKIMADRIGLPKVDGDDGRRSRDSSKVYLINSLAVLCMHQLGIGLDGLTTMFGSLAICSQLGNNRTW